MKNQNNNYNNPNDKNNQNNQNNQNKTNKATMNRTAAKGKKRFSPTEKAKRLTDMRSDTDVNGSYTGQPRNAREIPVQDADDL